MNGSNLKRGALAAAAMLTAACAGHVRASAPEAPGAGLRPAAAPTESARVVDAEPDVRDLSLRAIPELKTVRFDYDSDRLSADARAVLQANAGFLKANADMKVQVAGHCDQRGTVAYNLALGQRRARVVRDYYKALGVDAGRVATISWGKEHPACAESTEDCWSRNRRAETLEALNAKVAGSPR